MVYVDSLMQTIQSKNWPFKYSCHMFADSLEELHEFARKLGMKRQWFQLGRRKNFPHYDLTQTKRKVAIRFGAIELDRRQSVDKWIELGFLPGVTKFGMGLKTVEK